MGLTAASRNKCEIGVDLRERKIARIEQFWITSSLLARDLLA